MTAAKTLWPGIDGQGHVNKGAARLSALPPNDSRSNMIAKKTVKEASGLLALFTTDTTLEIKDRPDFLPVQKVWRPAISLLDQFFLDILPALEGT
jgi:hypothetical protein